MISQDDSCRLLISGIWPAKKENLAGLIAENENR
jgi:hypothetical protein